MTLSHQGYAAEYSEKYQRQTGVALISVLLIFAIAAALAARMMSNGAIQVEQASVYLSQQQVNAYSRGVETYVIALLQEDWKNDDQVRATAYDHPQDEWAKLKRFPLDDITGEEDTGGEILLNIEPLNSLFNISNLFDNSGQLSSKQLAVFKQLLTDQDIATSVADLTLDWIDNDNTTSSLLGAEDNLYLLKAPAYRTADQNIFNLSELLLLDQDQVSGEDLMMLEEQMVSLPDNSKYNLNWVSPELLAALTNTTPGQAEQWLAGREFDPISDVATFFTTHHPSFADPGDLFITRSQYFRVLIRVSIGEQLGYMNSIVHRNLTDGVTRVLSRNYLPFNKYKLNLEEDET